MLIPADRFPREAVVADLETTAQHGAYAPAMRSLVSAAVLALTLTACEGGGDDAGSGGDAFTAKGTVSIIGVDKADVLSATGAGAGERCQGTGKFGDFGGGDEAIVLDKDGSKVAVGTLDEGKLPENASALLELGLNSCELTFKVDDIPASDEFYTLRVGEKEVTFSQDDAVAIQVDVASDTYP